MFHPPPSPSKLSLIVLLCSGVVGLRLTAGLRLAGIAIGVAVRAGGGVCGGCGHSLRVVLRLLLRLRLLELLGGARVHGGRVHRGALVVGGGVGGVGGLERMGLAGREGVGVAAAAAADAAVVVVVAGLVAGGGGVQAGLLGGVVVARRVVDFHDSVRGCEKE